MLLRETSCGPHRGPNQRIDAREHRCLFMAGPGPSAARRAGRRRVAQCSRSVHTYTPRQRPGTRCRLTGDAWSWQLRRKRGARYVVWHKQHPFGAAYGGLDGGFDPIRRPSDQDRTLRAVWCGHWPWSHPCRGWNDGQGRRPWNPARGVPAPLHSLPNASPLDHAQGRLRSPSGHPSTRIR